MNNIELHAAGVLIVSPSDQIFRLQMVFTAIRNACFAEAAKLLVMAAGAHVGTDWSAECMQVAEMCFQQTDRAAEPRKALIAELLRIVAERNGAQDIDIQAAVYLANIHIDRGHSAAKAFAEGRRLLVSA